MEAATSQGTNAESCSLESLFRQGQAEIEAVRCENLFQQLETRTLTAEEELVIQQRVALQRRIYQQYEEREQRRKVTELQEVCPGLSEEEAQLALKLCNGREDDVATKLTQDATFLTRLRVELGGQPALTGGNHLRTDAKPSRAPMGPRGKKVDLSKLGSGVFVGVFRGKGYENASAPVTTALPAGEPDPAVENTATAVRDPNSTGDNPELPESVPKARRSQRRPSPNRQLPELLQYQPAAPQLQGVQCDALAGAAESSSLPYSSSAEAAIQGITAQPVQGNIEPDSSRTETDEEATISQVRQHEVGDAVDSHLDYHAVSSTVDVVLAQRTATAVTKLRAMDAAMREAVLAQALDRDPEKGPQLVAALYDALEGPPSPSAAQLAAEELDSDDEHRRSVKWQRSHKRSPLKKAGSPRTKRNMRVVAVACEPVSAPQQQCSDKENMGHGAAGNVKLEPAAGSVDQEAKETVPTCAVLSQSRRSSRRLTEQGSANSVPASPQHNQGTHDADSPMRTGSKRKTVEAVQPSSKRCKAVAGGKGASNAISRSGHTNRGRVRQKSSKSAELVEIGSLIAQDGWYNSGYIFPVGFVSRIIFRSSVHLDQLCVHECSIIGKDGKFWPKPTFRVVAMDRPDEPLLAASCTGCWTAILKRINGEIDARRKAGENLPPPPKTAIAGPEYFGLNQREAIAAIEALDPDHLCRAYWHGKEERAAAAAGLPVPSITREPVKPARARKAVGSAGARKGKRSAGSDDEGDATDDADEEAFGAGRNNWSAVTRADRYRKRREADGDDSLDQDNPLPDHIDPITLEPCVCPAISPYGHVMGMATWKAVLQELEQCPFTKQPLKVAHLKKLTTANIAAYRDHIVK